MFRKRALSPAAIVAGALTVAMVMALGVQGAAAQTYPAPTGNCFSTLSVPAPSLSTNVVVTVHATNLAGDPIADAQITGTILSQPGSDASLTPVTFTADAGGVGMTTLFTGSVAGTVVLHFTCEEPTGGSPPLTFSPTGGNTPSDDLAPPTDTTPQIPGSTPSQTTTPTDTQVTVSVGDAPGLPNTGTGSAQAGGFGASTSLLAALGVGLLATGMVSLTVGLRRSRRS